MQTLKIVAENWEDAAFMAEMWSIDEKASGFTVEEIEA